MQNYNGLVCSKVFQSQCWIYTISKTLIYYASFNMVWVYVLIQSWVEVKRMIYMYAMLYKFQLPVLELDSNFMSFLKIVINWTLFSCQKQSFIWNNLLSFFHDESLNLSVDGSYIYDMLQLFFGDGIYKYRNCNVFKLQNVYYSSA